MKNKNHFLGAKVAHRRAAAARWTRVAHGMKSQALPPGW